MSARLYSLYSLLMIPLLVVGPQFVLADRLDEMEFEATLTGNEQVPAVITNTTGEFEIEFNDDQDMAEIELKVRDGIDVTAAHLHFGKIGTNGPAIVSLFENAGGVDVDGRLARFEVTDANILPAGRTLRHPITNLRELKRAIEMGKIYVNVHSVAYPAGLIRGQLMPDD